MWISFFLQNVGSVPLKCHCLRYNILSELCEHKTKSKIQAFVGYTTRSSEPFT